MFLVSRTSDLIAMNYLLFFPTLCTRFNNQTIRALSSFQSQSLRDGVRAGGLVESSFAGDFHRANAGVRAHRRPFGELSNVGKSKKCDRLRATVFS
jgi:hypothetical protein